MLFVHPTSASLAARFSPRLYAYAKGSVFFCGIDEVYKQFHDLAYEIIRLWINLASSGVKFHAEIPRQSIIHYPIKIAIHI